jgi:hypothetical protein
MRTLLLILIAAAVSGCQAPKPSLSLKDARFAEGPVLVQRGEHFYMRYRRALDGNRYPLRAVLIAKKTDEAGFYYLIGPTSYPEWGNLVERPLAFDQLEEFAKSGSVYWLDPDGTKHSIPVRRDD